MLRIYILFLLTMGASGCAALPNAGPTIQAIMGRPQGAKIGFVSTASPYALFNVNAATVSALARHPPASFVKGFRAMGGRPRLALGVGDMLSVSIFESSPGGLFGSGDTSAGIGTKSTQLPPQQIDRHGNIEVPYAGTLRAAGRTPAEVSKAIIAALSSKAIEPQALVTLTQNASNLVTVSGEVGQGGRFPLAVNGTRVLDVIALAGGPRASASDIFVRLTRGAHTEVQHLGSLIAQPQEDVYLRPDDQIFLFKEPRNFTVLGAAGRNATIDFAGDGISLAEAIGKAGGLNDQRSDASGVFIFRYETAPIYRDLNRVSPNGSSYSDTVPVVYRLDLKDPSSFLWSQRFQMRNKDVLYISNAPSTDISKFLQLIGSGVGIVGAGSNVAQIGR